MSCHFSNANSDDLETKKIKKITILGDSLTVGYGSSTNGYIANIESVGNVEIKVLGQSGSKISEIANDEIPSFVDRVPLIDINSDLVIIFGGTNDYWHKKTVIGRFDSTLNSDFLGALNFISEYLLKNIPNAKICFISPFRSYYAGESSDTDFGEGTLLDFCSAIQYVANKYNFSFINLYEDFELNTALSEYRQVYARSDYDGIHLNDAGYDMLGQFLLSRLSDLYTFY